MTKKTFFFLGTSLICACQNHNFGREKSSVEKTGRRPWSVEEDILLIDLLRQHRYHWGRVMQSFPKRTLWACKSRYDGVLHCLTVRAKDRDELLHFLRAIRKKWSPEEDAKLIELVYQHGEKWMHISCCFGYRTPLQCLNRWKSIRDYHIWSPAEDMLLIRKYKELGPKWNKIALFFYGNIPGYIIRYRWQYLNDLMSQASSLQSDLILQSQITSIVSYMPINFFDDASLDQFLMHFN